ncbi:MAG: hypothetical protein NVS1B7_2420 [Candidatus Saccharimonadales bacterium]
MQKAQNPNLSHQKRSTANVGYANDARGSDPTGRLHNDSLQLKMTQILIARLEAASHQTEVKNYMLKREWLPKSNPELTVRVDYDPETKEDMVYSARVYLDQNNKKGSYYEASASPDGLLITQPVFGGRNELVINVARRDELIKGFAHKIQSAINANEQIDTPNNNVFGLLVKLINFTARSRTSEA